MIGFANLLERLAFTPQRNGKLKLLTDYFSATPDPARGYALAAIVGEIDIPGVKPAALKQLIYERMDPVLFDLSYDYVGDLAETIALVWPKEPGANRAPDLDDVIGRMTEAGGAKARELVVTTLNALDSNGRWAFIKLITGGLRVGVSARMAKAALADYGGVDVGAIEELWHGLSPPYIELFAWLDGNAPAPSAISPAAFRPVMLAHALDTELLSTLSPADFCAEWKWDGVRVQANAAQGDRRLYSRSGDDISAAFPDVLASLDFDGVIDGELLVFNPVAPPYEAASFGMLQKRLNRKTASKALLESHPAFIRAYDLLFEGGVDLRPLPFAERRRKLEALLESNPLPRVDLSPTIRFSDWSELASLRAAPAEAAVEGVMIKRKAGAYLQGRPRGEWWKWKRDPRVIDAVLMYAQRGHGKRSSFYSDFTFGVWREVEDGFELAPVGKAYFGFTDEELKRLDAFVRTHTEARFGPVRQVTATRADGLVLEIAFEGLQRSPRHKSGLAMRFPRISRIRWDKPPAEADTLATLEAMLCDP